MFDNITRFFKKLKKSEKEESKNTAKERLHLVLAQDRANISADFLEMMKQEIIEVIKKYIDIDEKAIDVRLTNKESEDGVVGAPALYANIPIITIKNEARQLEGSLEERNSSNANNETQKTDNIQDNNEIDNDLENKPYNQDLNQSEEHEDKKEEIKEKVEDVVDKKISENKKIEESAEMQKEEASQNGKTEKPIEESVKESVEKSDEKPVESNDAKASESQASNLEQKKNNKNNVNEVKDEKKDS